MKFSFEKETDEINFKHSSHIWYYLVQQRTALECQVTSSYIRPGVRNPDYCEPNICILKKLPQLHIYEYTRSALLLTCSWNLPISIEYNLSLVSCQHTYGKSTTIMHQGVPHNLSLPIKTFFRLWSNLHMPLFLSKCLQWTKISSWNGRLEKVVLLI